jgi:cell division protein FtsW
MAQQLKTDRILFYTVVAMVCFGLVVVFSASSAMAELKFKNTYYFIARQLFWAAASFVALLYFKRLDYRRFCTPLWAFAPLGLIIPLLLLAYTTDHRRHRWLSWESVSLQPSEFAKPALIIFLAYFLSTRLSAINNRHTLFPAILVIGALAVGVAVADLGTAVVLVATAVTLFFVAGLDLKYLAAAMGVGLLLGGVLPSLTVFHASLATLTPPSHSSIGSTLVVS